MYNMVLTTIASVMDTNNTNVQSGVQAVNNNSQ